MKDKNSSDFYSYDMTEMINLFVNDKWIIKDIYKQINQYLTPDFSVEDWLNLHEKAIHGDIISAQLLASLWKSKVYPYLKPEIKKRLK